MRRETDLGTLAPGRDADTIAVRGDVLKHIDLLQRVDVIIKNGVRVEIALVGSPRAVGAGLAPPATTGADYDERRAAARAAPTAPPLPTAGGQQ